MTQFLKLLNQFLLGVVLVVIIAFIWFVFAVSGAFMGIPLGYRLWTQLWLPLFQPALGILMAGAITSGIVSWYQRRRQSAD